MPDKTLLQFAEDIGSIKKGVDNLEQGQNDLAECQNDLDKKISGLHRNVADLVTKPECEEHRAALQAEATGILNQPGILESIGRRAKYLLAIGALVVMCGSALLVLYRLAGRVEARLAEPAKQSPVVYIPTPVILRPDAAVKPDAKPKRRRGRRGGRRGRAR
jgi:hypothetical protein